MAEHVSSCGQLKLMIRLAAGFLAISLLFGVGKTAKAEQPFLQGRVTDEKGRPVEGATVYIADCIGTCFGGAGRLTDADGKYVFEQKTFRNSPALSVSMPGRYHVSTDFSGPKLHEADSDVPRQANFVLGTPASLIVRVKGTVPKGWEQVVKLRAGRDAQLHRYDITGTHSPGWNSWSFPLVPRSESYHIVVVHRPRYELTDDPKENRKRRLASRDEEIQSISPPIRLVDTVRYDVEAQLSEGQEPKTRLVTISAIKDILGNDRTDELSAQAPLFGAPVDEATQQTGFELLNRIAKVAVPWNASPSESIAGYQYDYVDAKDNRTTVNIRKDSPKGPSWNDISRLRGVAYMPPLRWLFNQHDNVVFHEVTIEPDRAVLVYQLKESRGLAAGLGIGPSWNGFFSRSFSSGKITIDPKRDVVLEHRFSQGPLGEECVETFEDYVEVGEGRAPGKLRIEAGGFDLRLHFKVHDEILWLLDRARHGSETDPAYHIENVKVQRS